MDNKVGNEVPSEQEAQSLLAEVQAVRDKLEKFTIKLAAADRRYLAAFRPGGEAIVQLVGDLADKYGIVLPDMPTSGMRADLILSQRLAPLLSEITLLVGRLEDTLAQARSEAWQAATGNYTVLARVSVANPSLAKELAPARAFFARRRRVKPAESGGTAKAAKKPSKT